MELAISLLMTTLRDKETASAKFRTIADEVSHIMAYKALSHVHTLAVSLETPIAQAKVSSGRD